MKDKLGGQNMKEVVGLQVKTYNYLKNNDENKKAKGTKKCVIERKFKFRDYKKMLKISLNRWKMKIFKKKNLMWEISKNLQKIN